MGKNTLDRRVQRTRTALQEALIELILENGYESITVQDIIDRANVGRSTFYSHFLDKEALLLSEFEILRSDLEQHLSQLTDGDLLNFSLALFQHAQHYHNLYKAVVGKQSGQLIQRHLQEYLSTVVLKRLQEKQVSGSNEAIPIDIVAHHIIHSFMTLLIWWLDRDLPYSAEQMDTIYCQLMKSGIETS